MEEALRREIEAVAMVERIADPLAEGPGLRCPSLSGHQVVLSDGADGRVFALTDTQNTALFVRICREWEQVASLPGITSVVARREGPTPWIVVRQPGDPLPADSPETATRVLSHLAETLYRIDRPHGALTPSHVQVTTAGEPRLDWALGRLAPDADSEPYAPPETGGSREPDERTDVYGLGALGWALITGEPPPETVEQLRAAVAAEDAPGHFAVCRQALAPAPADRHASAYEFKQHLLFGDTPDHDAPTLQSTNPPSESPDSSADDPRDDEQPQRLTRRRVVWAGGLAVVGAGVGSQYLGAAEFDRSESPLFETTYESGLLAIRYTGDSPVDPSAVSIAGRGIGAELTTELSWAEFRPGASVEPGSRVSLGADPAYRIDIEAEDETVSATGPAAENAVPNSGQLPTPALEFGVTHRDGAVHIRPQFDAPARADHLRVTAREAGQNSQWRWHELAGTAPSRPPSSEVTLSAQETVVLSVAWAPPYFDRQRPLTQYNGPGRPKAPDVGGVSYPQYDRQNTGYEPTFDGLTAPELAWEADLPSEPLDSGSLVVRDGRVIVGGEQRLHCLDAADGEQLWQAEFATSGLFQPLLWDDLVLVGSVDGSGGAVAAAVDFTDGAIRWEFGIGHQIMWPPFPVGDSVVTGGTGLTGPGIYWLDGRTGEHRATIGGKRQQSRPATDGQTVYLNTPEEMCALTSNGVEWSLERTLRGQPTLAGESLYVVSDPQRDGSETTVVELAVGEESVLWESDPFQTRGVPTVAVADGSLFVGGEQTVHAIDPGSGWRWRAHTGSITGGPLVAGDQLHVTTTDGRLLTLDRETGQQRWSLSYGEQLLTPVVTDNWAFLRRKDGTVGGFR